MSSFIATADPTTIATPDPSPDDTVTNDGWFPGISLADLREAMRLDGTVTMGRLRFATLDAIAAINDELRTWKARQVSAGHTDLQSVPAEQLGGRSTNVVRYERAVYNRVRADLTEQYRGYDSTKSGGQQAEDLEGTICESRRNVRWAVNAIRGLPLSTVELI